MFKSRRIPASEIKNVRSFGGDTEVVFTERVPDGKIENVRSFAAGAELVIVTEDTRLAVLKRQVEAAAKNPRIKGILVDVGKKRPKR